MQRRIDAMQDWLKNPTLLQPDANAEYAEIIEIDLNEIKEPLLACPNDPDDIKPLSAVQNSKIYEVFIGSCMTNIGHYRAAGKVLEKVSNVPTRIWIAPPTKMDQHQLTEEGYYSIYGKAGARTEMPGCSLCMGNQARVKDGATVMSTSTRNFPNRLGKDANVFLASAELSAVAGILGRIPTMDEYLSYMKNIDAMASDEAMGCGVPVIATAVGGAPEIIDHGKTGWLLPQATPDLIAASLKEAWRPGPEQLHEMGLRARQSVEGRFEPDYYSEQIESLYLSLAEQRVTQ